MAPVIRSADRGRFFSFDGYCPSCGEARVLEFFVCDEEPSVPGKSGLETALSRAQPSAESKAQVPFNYEQFPFIGDESLIHQRLEAHCVRLGLQPKAARSKSEMEFAMSLQPCAKCGEREIFVISYTGVDATCILEASCSKCTTQRRMTFTVTPDFAQSRHLAFELGNGPSKLIGIETFRGELARNLLRMDKDLNSRRTMILCISEIMKLIDDSNECDQLNTLRSLLLTDCDFALAMALAKPESFPARQALLKAWKDRNDPRSDFLENQLAYHDHLRSGSAESNEALTLREKIADQERGHRKEWAGRLVELGAYVYTFHRGLVAGIQICGVDFVAHASELFALAPIQHLTLTPPIGPLEQLFWRPEFQKLISLNLGSLDEDFGDAGAIALARAPNAASLRWISLDSCAITLKGLQALAASRYLQRTEFICLKNNSLDPNPIKEDSEQGGMDFLERPEFFSEITQQFGPRPWLKASFDSIHIQTPDPELLATPGCATEWMTRPISWNTERGTHWTTKENRHWLVFKKPSAPRLYTFFVNFVPMIYFSKWPEVWTSNGDLEQMRKGEEQWANQSQHAINKLWPVLSLLSDASGAAGKDAISRIQQSIQKGLQENVIDPFEFARESPDLPEGFNYCRSNAEKALKFSAAQVYQLINAFEKLHQEKIIAPGTMRSVQWDMLMVLNDIVKRESERSTLAEGL